MSKVDSKRLAREIQEGACNPRAIARALVQVIDAKCDEGGVPSAKCAEVRLILHQLCHILGMGDLYFSLPEMNYIADTRAVQEEPIVEVKVPEEGPHLADEDDPFVSGAGSYTRAYEEEPGPNEEDSL